MENEGSQQGTNLSPSHERAARCISSLSLLSSLLDIWRSGFGSGPCQFHPNPILKMLVENATYATKPKSHHYWASSNV
ncbi:hypothetical protein CsSME_00000805 [Camellia sinensis var. sinensis]